MLVLEYTKNSKFEIEFTNLDKVKENDKIVLFLKDGDIAPFYELLSNEDLLFYDLFVPFIERKYCNKIAGDLRHKLNSIHTIYYFDNKKDDKVLYRNILPKYNIDKDSAVLFLSEDDKERYSNLYKDYNIIKNNYREYIDENEIEDYCFERYTKISTIIPELHAEDKACFYHIDNINEICRELKEKYRVEKIELFVSHCFVNIKYDKINNDIFYVKNDIMKFNTFNFIDKITTTNSTGYLHIQENDKLYVRNDIFDVKNDIMKFNTFNSIDRITTTNSTRYLHIQENNKLEVIDCCNFF